MRKMFSHYFPYYQSSSNGNSSPMECASGDSSPPVWPTAQRPTLSPAPADQVEKPLPQTLSSYLETSSRQLCFKQLVGSGVVYEAFFSMTNINTDSFLVARLSPRSSAYQTGLSKLSLLPYMQNKEARIYITHDAPAINDLFRLQVYVLAAEQSQRFTAHFETMDEKSFMSELRRATLIKFGCNLFVGDVVVADGDYIAACRSPTSQCGEVNDEWAGEGDMLDWTVGYPFPAVNEPYCEPSDENLPSRRPKMTVSGFVQTEVAPRRQTMHGDMQTDEVLKKQARSYLTQTERRAMSLAHAQTDQIETRAKRSSIAQTDHEQMKAVASLSVQVQLPPIPDIGHMQTDLNKIPELKSIRESIVQTNPLLPVTTGEMQTDAEPPKSLRESIVQTNPMTGPEPLVLTAVTHGFVQTTLIAVGQGQIQTDLLEVPVVAEGYMQTETVEALLPHPVTSGMMQTDAMQLILETKETFSHNIQTETRAAISGYMQTDPGETIARLVLTANMQTDVDIIPTETAWASLQTDEEANPLPVPTAPGYMQTDQVITHPVDTQTVPRSLADAAIGGKLYETAEELQTPVDPKSDAPPAEVVKTETPAEIAEAEKRGEDQPVPVEEVAREPTDWRKWAKLLALLLLLLLGLFMSMREGPFVDVMDWTGLGRSTDSTARFAGKAADVPGMATEKNSWIEGIKRKERADTEVSSERSKGWFSGWWSKEEPWRKPTGVDPLDDWKGEMPGTLPARRGLEGTSPDLGLTKEWLHTLALRFDGSTNSWNSLRSANDFGCRNEEPRKKKRCRDEYWGASKYVSCRIANSYDHHVYGI
ncbi:hypothetical protein RvY_01822 [Ramazzottius varieornatus]|uniref:Uncharacterized protein n=1 Tax=Ramazzottius varieornatus TaxID=947166 RepID=A0A1D1UL41_RAMVA|nr:hypothetical protein RvY_01822 [Ramazzottius varieornatus]